MPSKKIKIKEIPSRIKVTEKLKSSDLEEEIKESDLENFTEFLSESKNSGITLPTLNPNQTTRQSQTETSESEQTTAQDRDSATLPQVSYENPRPSQIIGSRSLPYQDAIQQNIRKEERKITPTSSGSTINQTATLRQTPVPQNPISSFQDPSMIGASQRDNRRSYYEERVEAKEKKVDRSRIE